MSHVEEGAAALLLARTAYEAYGENTGWRTFDGRQMPTWEGLSSRTVIAWVAAALAVENRVTRERGVKE